VDRWRRLEGGGDQGVSARGSSGFLGSGAGAGLAAWPRAAAAARARSAMGQPRFWPVGWSIWSGS
jgi:hypothetical protein